MFISLFNHTWNFSNTARYIDELLTLDNPSFQDEIDNIYPKALILKKTTEKLSFLDITILDNKFVTAVYDIREMVLTSTFLTSLHIDRNIPSKPAYGPL